MEAKSLSYSNFWHATSTYICIGVCIFICIPSTYMYIYLYIFVDLFALRTYVYVYIYIYLSSSTYDATLRVACLLSMDIIKS